MNSKQSSIRPLGQRSIPSTFLFRPKEGSSDCKKSVSNEKGSKVSLSEFLNRKLHRNSVLPGSVQRKQSTCLSPLSCQFVSSCVEGESKERAEREKDFSLDAVLQHFKDSKKEKGNTSGSAYDELGIRSTDDNQESRERVRGDDEEIGKRVLAVLGDESETKKRKKEKSMASYEKPKPLFNHCDDKETSKRVLAVLGDESKIKKRRKENSMASYENPKPLFNHYANGGGWWDCNMEGVDNEEVGCNEVWEGVGSTTLGGIEWH